MVGSVRWPRQSLCTIFVASSRWVCGHNGHLLATVFDVRVTILAAAQSQVLLS